MTHAYLRSLAVLQAWEGRTDEAIGTLQEALALVQKMDLPGELWEIEAKLAELFMANGEPQKAQDARNSALVGIQWLADKVDDAELRRGFLEFAQSQVPNSNATKS